MRCWESRMACGPLPAPESVPEPDDVVGQPRRVMRQFEPLRALQGFRLVRHSHRPIPRESSPLPATLAGDRRHHSPAGAVPGMLQARQRHDPAPRFEPRHAAYVEARCKSGHCRHRGQMATVRAGPADGLPQSPPRRLLRCRHFHRRLPWMRWPKCVRALRRWSGTHRSLRRIALIQDEGASTPAHVAQKRPASRHGLKRCWRPTLTRPGATPGNRAELTPIQVTRPSHEEPSPGCLEDSSAAGSEPSSSPSAAARISAALARNSSWSSTMTWRVMSA